MGDMLKVLREELRDAGMITVKVRVRAGASETVVQGVLADGTLKIAVAAPAERNRANAALVSFFADIFNVPKKNVTVRHGQASPRKIVIVVL